MPTRYIGMGYWEIASRQMSIVTKSQQNRFKEAEITVIGCGGIGGSVIEMLARMGIGKINLVDKDEYDLSNLNRQLIATTKTLNIKKTEAAAERVRIINPYVKVNPINEEFTEKNAEKIIKNSDIVIDALDNLITRIILTRTATEKEIPIIHGAIHGTQGEITVFDKTTPTYEELFGLPSRNKELGEKTIKEVQSLTRGVPPVIGPVPNIVGNMEAFEAYKYITQIGKIHLAPKLLKFDLLDLNSFKTIEL